MVVDILGYLRLKKVTSGLGTDAILEAQSENIGNILKIVLIPRILDLIILLTKH